MEKINLKKESIIWPLLILPIVYIIYVWGQLPDRIPIHFDLQGEANGWGSKYTIFLLPLMNIGIYLLFLFLPSVDPKRKDDTEFNSMFYKIRLVLILFLTGMCILATQAAIKGYMNKEVSHYIPQVVFLLFALLGNWMINIKPNWFIGVRTPWTLSSDTVWRKTHQVMGRMWFYGGLICTILAFVITDKWLVGEILVFAIGSSLFAIIYSFVLYKQEQKGNAHNA